MKLVLVLLTSIVTAFAWTGSSIAQIGPPISPLPSADGYTMLNEYYLPVLMNEPEICFHNARRNFIKKELKLSAEDLRKASVYLRLQAGRATDEYKHPLMESVRELEKLAAKIEKGTVTSVKELDNTFARAHQSLSKYHYLKALKTWIGKDIHNTGHDIKAAVYHLEHALVWHGHTLETKTKTIIKKARLIAEQLIDKKEQSAKKVNMILNETSKEIEKMENSQKK